MEKTLKPITSGKAFFNCLFSTGEDDLPLTMAPKVTWLSDPIIGRELGEVLPFLVSALR